MIKKENIAQNIAQEEDLIVSKQFQLHLAKKRKSEQKNKSKINNNNNKKAKKTRPGCRENKLSREDLLQSKDKDYKSVLELLNYPSIEKLVTPVVKIVTRKNDNIFIQIKSVSY